eukprot:TRINITY_DN5067_c0_g1_i1.p1 TRINITY_DN5067_c0_g1~~TRINITY_DN5067_c0_g1_i1.p1  ORF type:complete len:111 (+),score=10.36 TRINITY_DN5067_c0_g1_i1:69-401(+)
MSERVETVFSYIHVMPSTPTEVYLAGSFNAWKYRQAELKMTRIGKVELRNGPYANPDTTYPEYQLKIFLSPGVYEYKLIVDGEWVYDTMQESRPNSQGYINNVKVVNPNK